MQRTIVQQTREVLITGHTVEVQVFVIQRQLFRCQKGDDLYFLEIDPSMGQISEVFAQKDGDARIQNHMQPPARLLTYVMRPPLMWPSAPLLIYANWPPEAHEFDIPAVYDFPRENVVQ